MNMTLREDRAALFAAGGLDERAYRSRWLRFRLGPLPVRYPMTAARRIALPIHDLHHVVTGYGVDATGEAEVAAWEIASGCPASPSVWYGNLAFMALGLASAPRRTFGAFLRGRGTANLYGVGKGWPTLLERGTREVRSSLGLDREPRRVGLAGAAAFALAVPAALAAGASFVIVAPLLALAEAVAS